MRPDGTIVELEGTILMYGTPFLRPENLPQSLPDDAREINYDAFLSYWQVSINLERKNPCHK